MSMLVPAAHIIHLLAAVPMTDEEREGVSENAQSTDPAVRDQVLELLDPQVVARLRREYRYERPRTGRIWRVQPFDPSGNTSLFSKITENRKPDATGNFSSQPNGDGRRLVSLKIDEDVVTARVRLTKNIPITFEDNRTTYPSNVDIDLHFRIHHNACICESIAGQQDSKAAVKFFMEWALGRSLPDRKKDRLIFYREITFNDTIILNLAISNSWRKVKTEAVGSASNNGLTIVNGADSGDEREALDESEVLDLLTAPQISNDFGLQVPHADGYVERVEFAFTYKSHSSFGPARRCSVTAMRFIANAVLNVI